jgi:hypothetical protein
VLYRKHVASVDEIYPGSVWLEVAQSGCDVYHTGAQSGRNVA